MGERIKYFSERHLLSNILFIGVLVLGYFSWLTIGKEELPEFESNWVRVSAVYPGAPAEDVELFVTKPIEDELKTVVGLDDVVSTSSPSSSSFRIVLDDDYPNKSEIVRDIQDAVMRAKLPSEVRDLPFIRQFKSAEKAILDIGIYHKDYKLLDAQSRAELQKFVLSFENQLMAMSEISSVSRSHYLKPEVQIVVSPQKLLTQNISLAQIKSQIQKNHVRQPIGSLLDHGESKVTAVNELESVDAFQKLVLQSNFEGYGVRLADLSEDIRNGFQKYSSIFKVNGHEAVFLNVKKSISTDILTAQKSIVDFIEKYKQSNSEAPVDVVMMDDESYAVNNRLNIIGYNGLFGFVLIIIVLFVFLDVKTGFWVAMGIPFCMGFTLVVAQVMGYTVNSMTLAGIIIVLGIVVDDAIIIAENISRKREMGMPLQQAATFGAQEVVSPIFASIVTTCVAFVPLLYFGGFFGKLVTCIPIIVSLMLIASLLESVFILPSHLAGKTPFLDKFSNGRESTHWFHQVEEKYKNLLLKVLPKKSYVLAGFAVLLVLAGWVFHSKMKFVMFPREESKEVYIKIKAPKKTTRQETSKLIEPLEMLLAQDTENVVGVRSSIAQSRRGNQARENEASILVELHPSDDRKESLNELLKRWEAFGDKMQGLTKIKFLRGRWGHGSGNAIELQIQENDDKNRNEIVRLLKEKMESMKDVKDVEVDEPIRKKEYVLQLKQHNLSRLNISPTSVTDVLRTFVEGSILYSINKGEEEVDVRLSVPEQDKTSLTELLKQRVSTAQGLQVKLNTLIDIKEVNKPVNIVRTNFKRSTMIYANMADGSESTPLHVAKDLEQNFFPEIANKFPTSILTFRGEIEDTRESQGEFMNSIIIVVLLIFFILAIMFNSIIHPLLILSIVPFGVSGVIFVLTAHGMSVFGFFAGIGAVGMIGVVINDAIVMIDKIEKDIKQVDTCKMEHIASIASTRLRPVLLTTITTAAGILPTAYGFAGYDSMLAEMMLTLGWGLVFGTLITLILIPCLYTYIIKAAK